MFIEHSARVVDLPISEVCLKLPLDPCRDQCFAQLYCTWPQVLYVKNRVIFLTSTVDIKMARQIVAQLLYLDAESDEPIQLIINSGGGGVSDGLAIYDTMKAIRAPVHTYADF